MFSVTLAAFQLWGNPGQEWTGMDLLIARSMKSPVSSSEPEDRGHLCKTGHYRPRRKLLCFLALGAGAGHCHLTAILGLSRGRGASCSQPCVTYHPKVGHSLKTSGTAHFLNAMGEIQLWPRAKLCGWQGCLSSLVTRRAPKWECMSGSHSDIDEKFTNPKLSLIWFDSWGFKLFVLIII